MRVEDEGKAPEEHLGRQLRRLRAARGLSQAAVANSMTELGHGWHQTTVAKIENGARPVRLNEAADLASMFLVSLDELCSANDEETRLQKLRAREASFQRSLLGATAAVASAQKLAADIAYDLAVVREQIAAFEQGDDEVANDEPEHG